MNAGIFVLLLMIILAIASVVWRSARADALLARWAEESGHRILSRRLQYVCLLPLGRVILGLPFRWFLFKGGFIFRVAAVDGGGNGKSGYVLCRPSVGLMQTLPDIVEPRWDE